MAHSSLQRGKCARLLCLTTFSLLTAIPALVVGQESNPYGTRESAQSLEALRDNVREEIKRYEDEIARVDADIMKHKALMEVEKSEADDNAPPDANASDAAERLSKLSEARARYQSRLAALRVNAAAMDDRDKSLQSDIESERAMMRKLIQRIDREREGPKQELPPLKNAEVKIFRLVHAAPLELANIIDSIFSPAQLRLSIDERTKSLVVLGDKESLEIVEALLMNMDQPANRAQPGNEQRESSDAMARTVLVRVHWLADGLPEDSGEDADKYLPDTVVEAMKDLGLEAPQLVSQTVTSLTVDDQREVDYSATTPAILNKLPVSLQCTGRMRPMVGDKVPLDLGITVSGQSVGCELRGSLATPLGHYMVLGTANSVIPEQVSMPGMAGMPGGEMMGIEGGGLAPDFAGAAVDPAAGMPMGAAAEPTFNTLRFAFVVQVIEGQSYAPEE